MYSFNNDSSKDSSDWLDDFLGEDEEEGIKKELDEDKSLFNITEEQVEDPNFWINL